MNMRRIVGIDPGLQHTGWGVIEQRGSSLSFVGCGVISVAPKLPMPERLRGLATALTEVIALHQPTEAAMEETFATANGQSTLKLGQARGALMLTLAQAKLTVGEYAARSVKKAVVGTGSAEKHQVAQMVCMILPAARSALEGQKADAADALAIAITHAHSSG
jgi:crossover junction endodeoxyribonuclease RuvC